MSVKSENPTPYTTTPHTTDLNDDNLIVEKALAILDARLSESPCFNGETLTSPKSVHQYLRIKLVEREYEVFGILFLDNRHRTIQYQEMFRGTIDGCSVHPREVVKTALTLNAAAVILTHNHPSGNPEPSNADIRITDRLKSALAFVDIRVLDHIITGAEGHTSFAEKGLI